MLRHTTLLAFASAAALAVAVSAGGAPDRAAADPFIGTWTVTPAAGTPWASGGKVTISASTSSEVKALGPEEGNNGYESQCVGYDSRWPPGYENPIVSAWYVVTFSWSSTTMGGCISNKTFGHIALFGDPRNFVGSVQARTVSWLYGCWSSNFATGCQFFKVAKPSEGTTKTISEPAPGGFKDIESPVLPTGDLCGSSPGRALSGATKQVCDVGVSSSNGDLKGTVVVGEGEVRRTQIGVLVAACWLTFDLDDDAGRVYSMTPKVKLFICIKLAKEFFKDHRQGPATPAVVREAQGRALPSGKGCKTERIAIAVKMRKGRIASIRRAKSQKLSRSSVRYSCSASGGQATVTVSAPGALRKAVGKKLDLMVYRAKKAPRRAGKLSITFGWK